MTLSGITWDHPRGFAPLIASSIKYEELFGVKLTWEKRTLTHFGDQSLERLTDRFDLLIIDHPHVGIARQSNCLLPFNALLQKDAIDDLKDQAAGPSFASYQYKESLWAIPVDAATQCAVYRPDLLENSNVPKNWEEVFALAELLKEKKLWVGMALCPTDSMCSFLSITAQLGSPVQEGNKILVEREIGLQSLALMRKMRDNFHESTLGWNPIQLYDHMSTQEDIAYAPLAFGYTNYSRRGFRKNILAYANAPGTRNAVLGGAGIAVSSKTRFVTESAHFAGWIGSAAIQSSIYTSAQGQPASLAAWKSKTANELTNNFFSNTYDTLNDAYVRPRYSGWPEFQKYMGEVLHAHLIQNSDPVKVLNQLQEAYMQSYRKNN